MTQAQSRPALRLSLTPMLQPEAIPQSGTEATTMATEPLAYRANELMVRPGETSEMLLQIKNISADVINLQVEVKGNFPSSWCRWHIEGSQLHPNREMWVGIYFDVPSDFFERHLALTQQGLDLNYKSTVYIDYQEQGAQRSQRESVEFNLYVRPHSLYLQFLPALYREVDFIGRLMKIFEQTFEPSVWALKAMWAYLDPLTAPEALLPFLAHWVGWQTVPGLDLASQRSLIHRAIELYRWRGTKRGLRLYLHLYTGLPLAEEAQEAQKPICIEEPLGPGFVLGQAHLGQETVLGSGRPYHFIVRLRSELEINEGLVRTIIEQEKPSWCTYELYIEEPSS